MGRDRLIRSARHAPSLSYRGLCTLLAELRQLYLSELKSATQGLRDGQASQSVSTHEDPRALLFGIGGVAQSDSPRMRV